MILLEATAAVPLSTARTSTAGAGRLVAAGLVADSGQPILLTGNAANPPETLEPR